MTARVFDPATAAYAEFFVNPLKAAASLGSGGDRSPVRDTRRGHSMTGIGSIALVCTYLS